MRVDLDERASAIGPQLRQEKRKSEDSQNLNIAGYSVGAEVMAGGQLNPRIVSAPANGVILGVAYYPPDMLGTTL
jgi:hypothetical protein